MRYRVLPGDFQVEEVIRLPRAGDGPYTVYRVRKVGQTTLEVQAALARALDRPRQEVQFPALKDRQAIAWQYASVRGEGPQEVHGKGWSARRAGRARRPLRPSDLRGNRFTLVLRDLTPQEVAAIPALLEGRAHHGLPNYFDRQRFGSYSPDGEWVGKRILQGDAEGALRAHLSQPMTGDPRTVLAFKRHARAHWGEWAYLLEVAPRPSNLRSVLLFLRDHPEDHLRALNLVTPRVLSLYLAAYQGLLWNRIVGRFLGRRVEQAGETCPQIEIAGQQLPLYATLPEHLRRQWRAQRVPLPHHRVTYDDPAWAGLFAEVMAEEDLKPADLKARLLRRAYVGRGMRDLLLFPQEPAVVEKSADERFPDRERMTISFALPPGGYATLVLMALEVDATAQGSRPS